MTTQPNAQNTIVTPEGYTISYTEVTPDLATQLLDKNTNNRRVKKGNLDKIGEDMISGRWVFNGDAIRIDDQDVVIDGQHRLLQVEATGVTIYALLVTGLPSAVRATIDTNAVRTAADELQMRGYTNTSGLAALAAAFIRLDQLGLRAAVDAQSVPTTRRSVASTSRILEAISTDPKITELNKSSSTRQYKSLTRTMGTILFHEFTQLTNGVDDANEFFTRLRDGAQLAPDSPILRLRNVLDSAYANKRQRMSSSQVAGLTIKAWNAYRLGTPIRSLSYRQGGASPERFPEPI